MSTQNPSSENQPTPKPQGDAVGLVSSDLFEVFCDACYYDQWAVRPVGEKRWGHCYHLPSKEEAEGLAKELTLLAGIKAVAAQAWDASDQMDAIDDLLSSNNPVRQPGQPQPNPE